MNPETAWRRLWLDVTGVPIALVVAVLGLGIAALAAGLDDSDLVFVYIGAVPAIGAIAWIARTVWKASRRRSRLTQLLRAALDAHGENESNVVCDLFPDLPLCISKKWIYCARDKEVDVQPLDQMMWAYAEYFTMRYHFQLVVWNRSACANVLPLRQRYLSAALGRLRTAAPWLPVGYSLAMKETWNADHHDLRALVDACRQAGRPFDVPWAGQDIVSVAPVPRNSILVQAYEDRAEERELEKLTGRWDADGR
jgi:hypothetical protein